LIAPLTTNERLAIGLYVQIRTPVTFQILAKFSTGLLFGLIIDQTKDPVPPFGV
jgi:hypothetical protein